MKIEQFVMAYGVEQDRIRALLPDGFSSLRPVLRINAEIRDGKTGYVEFNTAAEKTAFEAGSILPSGMTCPLSRTGKPRALSRIFWISALPASGSRAAAQQKRTTQAAFFLHPSEELRPPEPVAVKKEFCDCTFRWRFAPGGAHGVSLGKTLPAYPSPQQTVYPRAPFTAQNAAQISCQQVLGSYVVRFER